jgi:hypothetical protein
MEDNAHESTCQYARGTHGHESGSQDPGMGGAVPGIELTEDEVSFIESVAG